MAGLIPILTFILLMSSSACTFLGTPNFSSLKEGINSGFRWVQSNNQAVLAKENKTQYVRFRVRIPNRPVNRKYFLAFTMEPAEKDSVLRKGKMVVTTKTRAEVRIILDIPERIEDKKGKVIPLSFVKKSRAGGGTSTFQTIGRGDLPVKAKLVPKDLSGKVLDAMQLEVLGEGKEDREGSNKSQSWVEKQSGIRKCRFSSEPALIEFTVSTGGSGSSVITILNEQDQPLRIKGYLQCISIKSSLSSFSSEESKGYFPHLVAIEPSEFDLEPGEEGKVTVVCQVPQGEKERYYARVILELDFPNETFEGGNIPPQRPDRESRLSLRSSKSGLLPSFFGILLDSKSKKFLKFLCLEKTAGVDIKREGPGGLSAVSQKVKKIGSNADKPLEFMITFKRSGKVTLTSDRKIAAEDYPGMAEEITLERQVELVFPEGIRDLMTAYNKELPPGKYQAEVSFEHGNRMLISQSHIFKVDRAYTYQL